MADHSPGLEQKPQWGLVLWGLGFMIMGYLYLIQFWTIFFFQFSSVFEGSCQIELIITTNISYYYTKYMNHWNDLSEPDREPLVMCFESTWTWMWTISDVFGEYMNLNVDHWWCASRVCEPESRPLWCVWRLREPDSRSSVMCLEITWTWQ